MSQDSESTDAPGLFTLIGQLEELIDQAMKHPPETLAQEEERLREERAKAVRAGFRAARMRRSPAITCFIS